MGELWANGNSNLVTDGDSLTFGAGVSTPYPALLTPNGGPWTITNKAVNGELMSTMLANAATNIDPLFNRTSSINAIILWACTNDLASGVTATTCYNNVKSYCSARHAVGWKCIVVTIPSDKNIEVRRDQFNAMLRADHSWADGLVDFAGTPLDCDGCWSNTEWFQSDGVHITEAGIQTYEVPLFNAVINSLIQ